MTHEAGKGDTMRPTNHKAFAEGMDRIFGKRVIEEDDEPSCPSCTGPMYTQAHWKYWQCDDCGRREDKEPEEP
jgi:tRNA(Ile2) C34 agmatinyltransferase TiaS